MTWAHAALLHAPQVGRVPDAEVGFESVLQQLDDESPEALSAGFVVAEPGLWSPGRTEGCK